MVQHESSPRVVKVCPYCGEEKDTRGFHFHMKACKEENDPFDRLRASSFDKAQDKPPMARSGDEPLRERYALQTRNMSPEQTERFLRKASGI